MQGKPGQSIRVGGRRGVVVIDQPSPRPDGFTLVSLDGVPGRRGELVIDAETGQILSMLNGTRGGDAERVLVADEQIQIETEEP